MTFEKQLDRLYEGMPERPDGTEEELAHFFAEGVYARRVKMKRGDVARVHVHTYDHLAIVASGKGKLMRESEITQVGPGDCIEVKAGERHAFLAEEDMTWFCVHGDVEEARRLYGGKR